METSWNLLHDYSANLWIRPIWPPSPPLLFVRVIQRNECKNSKPIKICIGVWKIFPNRTFQHSIFDFIHKIYLNDVRYHTSNHPTAQTHREASATILTLPYFYKATQCTKGDMRGPFCLVVRWQHLWTPWLKYTFFLMMQDWREVIKSRAWQCRHLLKH